MSLSEIHRSGTRTNSAAVAISHVPAQSPMGSRCDRLDLMVACPIETCRLAVLYNSPEGPSWEPAYPGKARSPGRSRLLSISSSFDAFDL